MSGRRESKLDTETRILEHGHADRRLLGAILMAETLEAVDLARKIIGPQDIFGSRERVTFESMLQMADRQEAPEIVRVGDDLRQRGRLDDVGGKVYLASLIDGIPLAKNGNGTDIEYYSRTVRDQAQERGRLDEAHETDTALDKTIAPFQKWLHLPDPDPLYAVLGAIAANRRPGDPIWLLIVSPSSWGKSELLSSAAVLPDTFSAATLTEASLLSGTPSRDKAKDAKGGLLRVIGSYGILLCKDFGSILNMSHDARAATLSALREVYDQSWTRHVGTDGGRTLHWEGKVGFLGGCTPTIDRHHIVMSSMGERFVFIRIPTESAAKLAVQALKHAGQEKAMRAELSGAVKTFFEGLTLDPDIPEMTPEERTRLIALTCLAVRCRSSVERDRQSRDIELIPGAESPGRLTRVAASLLSGLHVIGLPRKDAWRVMTRVILDSMPLLRRAVLLTMAESQDDSMTAKQVAETCNYPTTTARRQLEELACYSVVKRAGGGQGKADLWSLTEWTRAQLQTIGTFPAKSMELYRESDQPHLYKPTPHDE